MAFAELRNNKLRTFLSLLGITIGIFCIIAVFTLIDSLKQNISNNLASLGNNVLYVGKYAWMPEKGESEYPFWKYQARPTATLSELKQLKKNVPSIAYATILYNDAVTVKYNNNTVENITINAITYDFNHLQNFEIQNGRYFGPNEMEGNSNAVILGFKTAKELFSSINPIGKSIFFSNRNYYVIGVLKEKGKDITGFDMDNSIICSYAYLLSYNNIENKIVDNNLMIRPKENISFQDMQYEIKGALRAIRKIKPGKEDNFSFNLLSAIQNSINGIFDMINIAGGIIGIFSLLVGAFGIANIMFVTVKERTAQIGLKKAIGAQRNTILFEFLIEAIILSLIGGCFGILLVLFLAKILSGPVGFPVVLSLNNFFIGISISIVVGIISGLLPAIRASKLNPVEAIRS